MMKKAAMFLIGMALVVSTVYADPPAKVTGGGNIGQGTTLDFSLSCDGQGPNHLQVRSGNGDFRLDTVTSAICSDSGLTGTGTGTVNGVSDVQATYSFTDTGKGGQSNVVIFAGTSFGVGGYLPGIQFHNQ